MNKIIILHRDDLYGLTRSEPIANIVYESFPDPLLKFLDADFIAFEDDRTGLLKILKNNYGTCITISHEHFLMAIDRITQMAAMDAEFPKDRQDLIKQAQSNLFRKAELEGKDGARIFSKEEYDQEVKSLATGYLEANPKVIHMLERIKTDPYMNPIGIETTEPKWPGDMVMAQRMMEHALAFTRKELTAEEFHSEVENMAQYYGENIVVDTNYIINSEVDSAISIASADWYSPIEFPVNLCQAIIFFNPIFDSVFKVIFQQGETYFTSTLQISYPEIYAEIKKDCGFWCKDTDLYKQLLTIGCTHEECMINTILKAIYRFRIHKWFNRTKSLDHLIKKQS